MARKPFIVFEEPCWVMPDLVTILSLISTEEEAEEFLTAYNAVCGDEVADHNLRYMLRLIAVGGDVESAEWLADLFMVEVPERELQPLHTFGTTSYGIGEISKPVIRVDVHVEPSAERIHVSAQLKTTKKMKRVDISSEPGKVGA